jgi:hypothetical protein
VRYWLLMAGTSEEPMKADWYASGREWRRSFGEVSMFSRRPQIKPADRFVFYAVGSPRLFKAGRICAVTEVTGEPTFSKHDRWPWEVTRTFVVAGPRLEHCPTLSDIDVSSLSVRSHSHIRLTEEQGRRAEKLIAEAARKHGSVLPG